MVKLHVLISFLINMFYWRLYYYVLWSESTILNLLSRISWHDVSYQCQKTTSIVLNGKGVCKSGELKFIFWKNVQVFTIYILLQIITIFFYNLNNNYTQFKSFLSITWIYGIHEKLKIIYLPQLSLSPSHLHTYSSVSLSLSHHQHSFLLQIYCLYIFSSLIKDRAISIHFFFILSIIKVTQQINLNKYIFF